MLNYQRVVDDVWWLNPHVCRSRWQSPGLFIAPVARTLTAATASGGVHAAASAIASRTSEELAGGMAVLEQPLKIDVVICCCFTELINSIYYIW